MNEQEIKDYIDRQVAEQVRHLVLAMLRPRLEALMAEFEQTGSEMLSEVRAMTDILAQRLDLLTLEMSSTTLNMNELTEMVYSFKQEIAAALQELNNIRELLEHRPHNGKPMLLH